MLAGLAIILSLPLPPNLRLLISAAWLAGNISQGIGLLRGAARIQYYSIEALDSITGIAPDGRNQALILLEGSVVLSRFACLRVRFPDGSSYVELLRGAAVRDRDWLRLQLIWRLRRTVVGAHDGS